MTNYLDRHSPDFSRPAYVKIGIIYYRAIYLITDVGGRHVVAIFGP